MSTYRTQQQNLSRKRAITQPKFGGWLPISNLTCSLQWCIFRQTSNEINASLQRLSNGNQYQQLSRKRTITQPKFGGWLPISTLTCILQCYKFLQTLNKINASLQKSLSRNEKCDHMIPKCLPCYIGSTKIKKKNHVFRAILTLEININVQVSDVQTLVS